MIPALADRFIMAATEAKMWREENGGILCGDDLASAANNWTTSDWSWRRDPGYPLVDPDLKTLDRDTLFDMLEELFCLEDGS